MLFGFEYITYDYRSVLSPRWIGATEPFPPSGRSYWDPDGEMACGKCGVIALHRVESGRWGPHTRCLVCQDCGAFLRWLPAHSPEHRQRQRETAIAEWMAQQPPTNKQLSLLQRLGHGGQPANRLEASQLIDRLMQQRAQA